MWQGSNISIHSTRYKGIIITHNHVRYLFYPSTGRTRLEIEFQTAIWIVYPIPRFLVVAVDMSKPTNSPSDHFLKVSTVRIKKSVVILRENSNISARWASCFQWIKYVYRLILDIGHGCSTIGLNTWRGYRGPPVLSWKFSISQRDRCQTTNHLVEVHFLAFTVTDKPVEIG